MSSTDDPLRLEYGRELHGLTVVRQAPPAGAVSFSATYVGPAGWGFDRPGEEATARIVNQLLTSGAGRYDRVALARRLDRAGATLTPECAPESGEVTIWGPADDWPSLLALFADVVLRPRFSREDFERVRRQVAERQLREMAQPASRADVELFRATYPEGHPYRTNGLGNARSLARIRPESLRRFHHAHYTSGDAVLVVTAPARLSAVEAEVRRHFSEFPETSGSTLRFPAVGSKRPRTITIPLPGRSEVDIRVGGDSIPRSDPDYPAAFLANEILGGRGQLSRLFQRIRERGGLVYHAASQLEAMRFGGHWTIGAGTGPDHATKVLGMLSKELDRLETRDVTASELGEIRESAIGEIPLALESTADAHELAVEVAYHRLPEDYFTRWPTTLREVRPKAVRAAAERALDRHHAVSILAGPTAPK
jgi:zinc protease